MFVPGGLPDAAHIARTSRSLEHRLPAAQDNLCKLVTLTGPTKCGKTVLAKKVFPADQVVWIDDGRSPTEASILFAILSQLDALSAFEEGSSSRTGGIPKYANHFGVKPRDPNSAFRPIPEGLDLRTVLCAKTTREVANDNTSSYQGQIYQLKPNTRTVCIAGTKVSVQEWFDASIHVRHERAGTISVQERTLPTRPRRQIARSPHDILAVV